MNFNKAIKTIRYQFNNVADNVSDTKSKLKVLSDRISELETELEKREKARLEKEVGRRLSDYISKVKS